MNKGNKVQKFNLIHFIRNQRDSLEFSTPNNISI